MNYDKIEELSDSSLALLEDGVLGKVLIEMFARSVQIISGLNSQSKFQMFTLFSGRHVGVPRPEEHQHGGSILGSVNLCKILRKYLKFRKTQT